MPSSKAAASIVSDRLENTSPMDWVIIVGLLIVIVALIVHLYTDSRHGIVQEAVSARDIQESFQNDPSSCANYYYERFSNPPAVEGSDAGAGVSQNLTTMTTVTEPKADELILLFIHHNKCGHCHNFRPMWNRLCAKYQGAERNGKRIRLLECGNDTDESLWNNVSKHYSVQGYPTIMVVRKDGASEYNGPRNEYDMWCAHIEQKTSP